MGYKTNANFSLYLVMFKPFKNDRGLPTIAYKILILLYGHEIDALADTTNFPNYIHIKKNISCFVFLFYHKIFNC